MGYLSGFAFGGLFRRLRFGAKKGKYYHQQTTFLLARKYTDKSVDLPEHKLVTIRDRGGLWKVSMPVIQIFSSVEIYFKFKSNTFTNKIDSKEIVADLMKNAKIRSNFIIILNLCSDET